MNAEAIRAAHAEEVRAARPVTSLDELPLDYEHLTPEWLSALVGGAVTGFRWEDADDLGRGHARVWLEGDGVPESVFCKDSHRVDLRVFNAFMVAGEVDFYDRIVPAVDFEVPDCLFAAFNPETYNSLLVFSDLREHGLDFCTEQFHVTRDLAEGQVRHLARVHTADAAAKRPFREVFEVVDTIFGGAFGEAVVRGFDVSEAVIPAAVLARREAVWPAVQQAVETQFAAPPALTHNDCHIDNWYPSPSGGLRMGDWQIVAQGDPAFDLALTVVTSPTIEDRRAWERDLVALYEEASGARGMWDRYVGQLPMVLAWWTPTLARKVDFDFHDQAGTMEIIRRVTTAIDDHGALG